MPVLPPRIAAFFPAVALAGALLVGCTAVPAPIDTSAAEPTPAVSAPAPSTTPTTAATDPGPSRAEVQTQEEYAAAVAAFPLAMPDGYTFPEAFPDSREIATWFTADGRTVAYAVWRCSVAQAARDAYVLDGDRATAETLLSAIPEVGDDLLRGNSDWVEMILPATGVSWAGLEGETGMCYFWLRPFGRWNV